MTERRCWNERVEEWVCFYECVYFVPILLREAGTSIRYVTDLSLKHIHTCTFTPEILLFFTRALVCRNGQPHFVTVDHKPDQPAETERIVNAGGFVAARRVCRCLAVSRALGDHYFKNKEHQPKDRMVSCVPVSEKVDVCI